ncbi:MAG: hypothetical protein ACM3VT_04250 [Solirubrobacterales bacterium]
MNYQKDPCGPALGAQCRRGVEPGKFKFVSTKSGRRFYAADSAEAILIRLDDFVGYETVEAARADGKMPPP